MPINISLFYWCSICIGNKCPKLQFWYKQNTDDTASTKGSRNLKKLPLAFKTIIGKRNFNFNISPLDGAPLEPKTWLFSLARIWSLMFFDNITTKISKIRAFQQEFVHYRKKENTTFALYEVKWVLFQWVFDHVKVQRQSCQPNMFWNFTDL